MGWARNRCLLPTDPCRPRARPAGGGLSAPGHGIRKAQPRYHNAGFRLPGRCRYRGGLTRLAGPGHMYGPYKCVCMRPPAAEIEPRLPRVYWYVQPRRR
eukprot:scaffold979_cov382-Prasinococcus_capsulatus_cf.AAC.4